MKRSLHFRDMYMTEGKIFFSAVEMNGLFYVKKGENTAIFLSKFTGEDPLQLNLHSKVIQYENKLYFIPLNGKGITICCLKGMRMEMVPYKNGKGMQIINAFLMDGDIIMMPLNFKTSFLIFHTEDRSYEEMDYIENVLNKIIRKEEFWLDTFSAAVNGKILYMALPGKNFLFEVNLQKRDVKIIKLNEKIRLNAVEYFDGKLFLSALGSSHIYTYRIKDGEVKIIEAGMSLGNNEKENIVISNGIRLYIVSPYYILYLNDEGSRFEKITDIPENFRRRTSGYRLFAGKRVIGNTVWLFSASGGGVLFLEENHWKIYQIFAAKEMEPQISMSQVKGLAKEMDANRCISENQCANANLNTFIDLVVHEIEE